MAKLSESSLSSSLSGKTLSTEEAAKLLGVSIKDIQSLVKSELLEELSPGVFYADDIAKMTGTALDKGLTLAQEAAQVNVRLQREVATSISLVRKIVYMALAGLFAYVISIAFFLALYTYYPTQVAGWVNQDHPTAFQAVLQQPGGIALGILKYTKPSSYKAVTKVAVVNPTDLWKADGDGSISPTGPLKILSSSDLQIFSRRVIDNLNAEFLQGKVPGTNKGDVALIGAIGAPDTNSVTTTNIVNGAIQGVDIANGTITTTNIAGSTITGSNIANGTITTTNIAGSTITGSNIANGTISNGNLSQLTSSNLVAGSAVQLSGNGGLTNNAGLSLLTSCSDTQVLQWNGSNSTWECASNSGSGGGGITAIREGGATIVNIPTSINFDGTDFTVTESPAGVGNIAIDYTNSGITQSTVDETITGSWSFPSGLTLATQTFGSHTLTDSGALAISSSTNNAVTIDSGTTGAVNVGTGANAKAITIGNNTAGTTLAVIGGNTWSINTSGTLSTTGNLTTTGTGSITSAGVLTASNGLTLTTGAINLTGTSGSLALSGLGASSINTGSNALTITSSNINTTATGINGTAIGATTPSTGAFTSLTSTGTSNIGSGTGVVTLNSSGALNLTGASPSTWTVGANTLAINSSNFTLNSSGTISLAGGQTQDITTGAGSNPTGLTIRPGANTTNSGTGALLTISGGNESGTTSTGGNVTITAGTGTSTNGTINIGTTNTNAITIGATGITTTNTGALTSTQTLTASNGLTVTTGAINITGTSGSLALTGLGTSSINTGSNVLSFTSSNFNTTATGINATAIGATTPAAGTFTSLNDSGLTASSIVYTDASKNLTSTVPSSGTLAFWTRSGTTLSPGTAGDAITTSGTISTSGTGTITSAGLLTAANGLTLTTGAVNVTGTSGALTLSGLSSSSINTGSNGLTFTSSNFNTTATGINGTAIGATTPSTGKFTTLTSTGATDLGNTGASNVTIATTGSGNVTIGNGTGTFALTSNGGLNITTAGALTGVASLDTIGVSANALTFAGSGSITSATTSPITIDSGTSGGVNIGTGLNAKTVTLGNTTTTSTTNINSGTGNITLQAAGTGTTGVVQIGAGGSGSSTPDFFALDVKSDTGDPTGGANGFMYYNTFTGKFRCFEGGLWKNCDTTGGTTTLQSAYDAGQTITISSGKPMSISGSDALTLTSGVAATWGTSVGNLTLQVAGTSTTANVQIGAGGGGSATPDFLVVDQSSVALPAATNGAIVLDSTGKFNIYESGAWKVLCNTTDQACGAGSGSALSAITAATTGTTINSANNAQIWNWDLTTATKTAFTFGENVASTNGVGSQYILGVSTLAGSTAAPLRVIARGNAIIDTTSTGGITLGNTTANTPITLQSGTGTISIGADANAKTITIGTATGGTTLALTGGATWSISTAGNVTTTGNVSTTGSGTMTSAGLLTASNGLTVTTGAVNITGTSGALSLTGLGASSINTGSNALTITSSNINTTATGINATAIGATTPSTGAFTTLSASGQITSTVSTGTAPFVVASTTNVANLNASSLNGLTFAAPGAIGGGTAAAGTFTTLTGNTSLTDAGLSTAGVVTNTSGGLLGTLAGTTTTVLHGNAAGLPTFSSVSGSDLASNISISTTGNISTTSTGAITSAGLLTGSNGLTVTTGAVNITGTSGALALSGLGASSINAGSNGLTFTSSNFNTTATGINGTAIGTDTPSTGKFTSLTATGTSTIGSGTGVVTINSSGAVNLTGASPSTWTVGANALTITSSNFTVSSAGVITLAGGQTADITTLAGTSPTALVFQPGNNTTNSGTGATVTLRGGNNSGTTSTGGNLVLTAGTGTATNGTITIGTTNTAAITLGATGITTTNTGAFTSTQTVTASNGLTVTTGAVNITGTSGAVSLTGLSASSINTGSNGLTITASNFNTTATGINNTAIGATTASTGAFTSLNDSGLSISSAVYTDASKNLTTTAPTTGILGYWNRSGTTLSPATSGDAITTSGNISTTSTGTITSAALLTASNGLTVTTGAVNITGTSGGLSLTGLGASTLSTTSNGLTLRTVTSGTLAVTSAGALNLTGGSPSTWTLGANSLTLTSSNFNVSSAGVVTLAGGQTVDLTTPAATTMTIDSGTTGALNIGNQSNAKTITLGNTTGATAVNINSGTGNITFTAGPTSSSSKIQVGNSGTATPDLFVLDNGTADPTGVNGGMYYNTTNGKFRCYENSSWKDCLSGSINLSQAASYKANDTVTTVTNSTIILGTVSVTPTTASGDVFVTANADVNSNSAADQAFTFSVQTGATCTGTVLGTRTYTIATAASTSTNVGSLIVSGIDKDPGASAHTYSLCAVNAAAGQSTNVTNWHIEALVVDTAGGSSGTNNPSADVVSDTSVTAPTPGTSPTYGTEVEILTPTNPTLTPDSTNSRILISGEVQYANPSTGDDTETNIRIRIRRGAGNCAGTQVGPDFVAAISDPLQQIWIPFTLIDSPNTASSQSYTICAASYDSNGATAPNATISVADMAIQEVAAAGADLAEIYGTNDTALAPADVVSLDNSLQAGVKKSSISYDPSVFGVVSTQPALVMGVSSTGGIKQVPVALAGRVPVNVNTQGGAIKAGDALTTSSVPGVAMKASKAGPIIGMAMNDFAGSGVGQIMVFLKNGSGTGTISTVLSGSGENGDANTAQQILTALVNQQNTASQTDALSQIATDRLTAGLEIITPRIVTRDILGTGVFSLVDKNGIETVAITASGDATFSGTLTVNTLQAKNIEGLDILVNNLQSNTNQRVDTSTSSASLDQLSVLIGEVSPKVNQDGTDNGLSTLVADMQKEQSHDPVALITQSITNKKQFLVNFIAARVTAIRGYFDEVFAQKVHTRQLCVKKSDGSEVCVNGDQMDSLLKNANIATPTPLPMPTVTALPNIVMPTPTEFPTPTETASSAATIQ